MRKRTGAQALLLVALLVGGCATKGQVEDIVAESNALLIAQAEQRAAEDLLADSALLMPSAEAGQPLEESAVWRTVQEIDAFLEDHPDLTQANNALRVRKAVLLAFAGQPNMAKAAFEAYTPGDGNARDEGLYRNHDTLTWWWGTSADAPRSNSEIAAARADLPPRIEALTAALTDERTRPPRGSEIQLYLAAVRAHMQWKLASTGETRPEIAQALREGLAAYCGEFDAAEQARVQAWMREDFSELGALPAERWRMYGQAEVVRDRYVASMQDALSAGADPAWPEACDWLTKPPAVP